MTEMVNMVNGGERRRAAGKVPFRRGFLEKIRNGERVNGVLYIPVSMIHNVYEQRDRVYPFTRSPFIYFLPISLIITAVLGGEHHRSPSFTMFTTPLDKEHNRISKHRDWSVADADEDGWPVGPSCQDCRFWQPPDPSAKDRFGICHRAVSVRSRFRSIEAGTLIALDEIRQRYLRLDTELMRTRAWAAACSLFVRKDDV